MKPLGAATIKTNLLLDAFYPVGAIVFNTNSTYDPNKILGGKWELMPDGVFLSSGKEEVLDKSNGIIVYPENLKRIAYEISGGSHTNHSYTRDYTAYWNYSGWEFFGSSSHQAPVSFPDYSTSGGQHKHGIYFGTKIDELKAINCLKLFNQYSVYMWKRVE